MIPELTALIIALSTLLGIIIKYDFFLNKIVEFALKKAMHPNINYGNAVRDSTRTGVQTQLSLLLDSYDFVDFFLVLRLDKNGKYWISQEELISRKKVVKKPKLHRTPANEYVGFWEEVTAKGFYKEEELEKENLRYKKFNLLLKKYDVNSFWAYNIPDSKIMIIACSLELMVLHDEVIYLGDELSKTNETMRYLYNYRLQYQH